MLPLRNQQLYAQLLVICRQTIPMGIGFTGFFDFHGHEKCTWRMTYTSPKESLKTELFQDKGCSLVKSAQMFATM